MKSQDLSVSPDFGLLAGTGLEVVEGDVVDVAETVAEAVGVGVHGAEQVERFLMAGPILHGRLLEPVIGGNLAGTDARRISTAEERSLDGGGAHTDDDATQLGIDGVSLTEQLNEVVADGRAELGSVQLGDSRFTFVSEVVEEVLVHGVGECGELL